jgi:hypothetical protein
MDFQIRHSVNTDPETYWSKIFFDDDFNQEVFMEGMKFKSYEVLENTINDDGSRKRRVRAEPNADAPAVVKKLIGGSLSYTEDGSFDSKTNTWSFKMTMSTLSDKIQVSGKIRLEPRGDKKLERIVDTTINVKIFGVGGVFEKFIEKTTRESHDKAVAFTNQYIAKKDLG